MATNEIVTDRTVPPTLSIIETALLLNAGEDMLAALKRAQPVLETLALDGPAGNSVAADIRDDVRAAIAKAEGRVL